MSKAPLPNDRNLAYSAPMTKTDALNRFDNNRSVLARFVGVTPQAISDWPEELPDRLEDRVIAALMRAGKRVPKHFLKRRDTRRMNEQEAISP